MTQLIEGTRLITDSNNEIIIEGKLGAGGSGCVYLATYKGEKKAVKVFYTKGYETEIQRRKLDRLFRMNFPDGRFVWPLDLIVSGDIVGYVMDLVPPEYCSMGDILRGKAKFSSFRAVATAAIEIAAAMRCLHAMGFIYPDYNTENIFIDPNRGKVRICDTEQITVFGKQSNIMGTPRFMAPEIVRGEREPSTQSERFSLAVIIFLLLTMTHPLEGKRSLSIFLTPEMELQLYGTDPVFILDPDDDRNRPVTGVHVAIEKIWPELPSYMKDMFIRQFSREVMMHPEKRATEGEWLDLLMRFYSEIVPCPSCGGDSFGYGSDENNPVCSFCGSPLPIQRFARSKRIDYLIPLIPRSVIRRAQLGVSNLDAADAPVFSVLSHKSDPSLLGLRNITNEDVQVQRHNSPPVVAKPGDVIKAAPGTIVTAFGNTLEIV